MQLELAPHPLVKAAGAAAAPLVRQRFAPRHKADAACASLEHAGSVP
jgi:hypothetical protein